MPINTIILNRFYFQLEKEYIEQVHGVRGMRFELIQKEEGDASNRLQSEILELSKLLNVDGDVVACSVPKIDVR